MSFFRNASISRKLTFAFIFMGGAAVALASGVFLAYDWVTIRKSMVSDLTGLSAVIGNNSTAALSFNDPMTAAEVLSALKARPYIEVACIYEHNNAATEVFAQYRKAGITSDCPLRPTIYEAQYSKRYLTIAKPIMLDNTTIGSLFVRQNLNELWEAVMVHLQVIGVVVITSLGLAFIAAALLQQVITKPILSLASTAQRITESKNYALRAPEAGEDEVGKLTSNFNSMLSEIEARDDAVRKAREELQDQVEQTTQAYHELQETMKRLKETQRQLVQTEKMASLGGLVAGVAHEINTPVGVGVTAASTLKARTDETLRDYDDKQLTESALKGYLKLADQSSEIILTNLSRAAELIHSFKQVAVDQTSSDRREFELASYLDEILLSLRPKLKNTQHKVEINCPSGLLVDSYPGALSQIVTNLIMNSLIHGFEHLEQGVISLNVQPREGAIHLHYEDNGCGIPANNRKQIFDPFFTTKRGYGGSGLGLHIVYNLITHTLNGHIKLDSEREQGTAFDIVFPQIKDSRHEQAS